MRFEGLDLNLLVELDVLLDTQSVTEASRRLNLSQPSVSAALGRLREFFDDDLLIQVGRRMAPTAKGQSLAPAIKDMLNLVRFRIVQAETFDTQRPRTFRILASDYVYDVLLSKVLARVEVLAPQVTFDVAPTGPSSVRSFLNGDIDLMITAATYVVAEHPQRLLFSDVDSLICWNQGRYAAGVTANQFLEAGHAVAVFGEERLRLLLLDEPFAGPGVSEVVQWHRLRDKDAGARWLIDMLIEEAAGSKIFS